MLLSSLVCLTTCVRFPQENDPIIAKDFGVSDAQVAHWAKGWGGGPHFTANMTISEFEQYINKLRKLPGIPPIRNLRPNETFKFTDPYTWQDWLIPVYNDCKHAPNTVQDDIGDCVCEANFARTDPDSLGCWNCLRECHTQAFCAKGNVCRCRPSYFGNGNTTCTRTHPSVIALTPTSCTHPCRVIVTTDATWTPDRAFCRFDGRRVAAESFGPGTASCLVPEEASGKVNVEFSLDGDLWVGARKLRLPYNTLVPMLVLLVLAVGSGSAMIYKVQRTVTLFPTEEQA
jgi:hypothetical protein